ncbi:MAG: phosphoribosylglycinamide formyltransferase [Oscillospiraceae bacterium]|jgi:phosphoribosylglycinamide formyltransferase-1|nr:phosphoribosylglycinamide formyltransferase [Oscillospiraceae bacterium]
MLRIVVLVSGGGTNLQALIDAQKQDKLGGGRIVCVLSSKPDVYALERAAVSGIPTEVVSRKQYSSAEEFDDALLCVLEEYQADLVVLAGFLSIFGSKLTKRYENKIINVHPSLIPSFCGKGFYGLKVHEAALQYGVKVTGATVHFVNEITDGGAIILQKAVEIRQGDTAEVLQRRVMEEAEWQLLPKAVELFCKGRIAVEDNRVVIDTTDN